MRRESILEDSYRIINSVTKTDLLKTKLWVEFEGEAGKVERASELEGKLNEISHFRTRLRWPGSRVVLLAVKANVQSLLW